MARNDGGILPHPVADHRQLRVALGAVLCEAVIARFLPLNDAERAALTRFAHPTLRNWNGFEVGAVRVTEAIV